MVDKFAYEQDCSTADSKSTNNSVKSNKQHKSYPQVIIFFFKRAFSRARDVWSWLWSVHLVRPLLKQHRYLMSASILWSLGSELLVLWSPRFLTLKHLTLTFGVTLKGVCLLHLLSENIFPVLRSNWFYVLLKQKLIWNLSLCYFSLFCFYLSGYDARTAERKSDSTWRTWYKQTARVYHSRRPISWLIPKMQYPVIYIIKFSNN